MMKGVTAIQHRWGNRLGSATNGLSRHIKKE